VTQRGRPPPSPHGRLFGGDSLYEVLAVFAAERAAEFSTATLASRIGRTHRQTRKEIRKLEEVGAVRQIRKDRKEEWFAPAESEIAETLLSMPDLLVARLGKYRRS